MIYILTLLMFICISLAVKDRIFLILFVHSVEQILHNKARSQ